MIDNELIEHSSSSSSVE